MVISHSYVSLPEGSKKNSGGEVKSVDSNNSPLHHFFFWAQRTAWRSTLFAKIGWWNLREPTLDLRSRWIPSGNQTRRAGKSTVSFDDFPPNLHLYPFVMWLFLIAILWEGKWIRIPIVEGSHSLYKIGTWSLWMNSDEFLIPIPWNYPHDGSMVTPSWPRIPSHGGCFPIELGGPFIEAISLAFAYTHHPTSRVDARGGAGRGWGALERGQR